MLVIDDVIDDALDEEIADEETNEEALDEATDDATEELDTPPVQMPAIALPLTLSESILAISCEPVARRRSWLVPLTSETFLVTVLQLESDAVRGNDKLPDEPFTVNPALVDPILA